MRAVKPGTLFCALAAALFAPDALAWGLQTHVFLAQWLLAAAASAQKRVPGFTAVMLPCQHDRAMTRGYSDLDIRMARSRSPAAQPSMYSFSDTGTPTCWHW